MAQSATTVTPENPTPPTNLSCVSGTPVSPTQAVVDDGITNTYPVISQNEGGGVNGTTAPSVVGNTKLFAAKTASADNANYPSVDGEGRGTETSVTMTSANPSPAGQLVMVSCLGNYTTSPNAQHASSLSPATNPALTTAGPTVASGGGTAPLTATGTNFTRQSQIVSNGIAYATTFVSSTSLTCTAAKKATAGTLPVYVQTGGVVTNTVNWTFT